MILLLFLCSVFVWLAITLGITAGLSGFNICRLEFVLVSLFFKSDSTWLVVQSEAVK